MLLQRRQWTTSSVDMVRRRLSWYISRMDGGSPTERKERADSARSLRFQQCAYPRGTQVITAQ